jgi:hypothetical protein
MGDIILTTGAESCGKPPAQHVDSGISQTMAREQRKNISALQIQQRSGRKEVQKRIGHAPSI